MNNDIGMFIAKHIIDQFLILFNNDFKYKEIVVEESGKNISINIFSGEFNNSNGKLPLFIFSFPQKKKEELYDDIFLFIKESDENWYIIKMSIKDKSIYNNDYIFAKFTEEIVPLSLKEKAKILWIFESIISAGLTIQKTKEKIPEKIIEKIFDYEL